MSAELAVRAAVLAALQGDAALMDQVNGVYDGPPVKASEPYVLVGDEIGTDWGTKDVDGREVRIGVSVFDRLEAPSRIAGISARVHLLARGLSGVRDGWRIVGVALVRSRTMRARDQGWSAVADYRVRVLRE